MTNTIHTDCSGYELHYAYEALGRIREAEEQAQNASIGASVITGGSTGDKYEIKYLSDHTRRTKNRNGVCMNYLFNGEGDVVTQYESETYAASAETPGIIGKATYNRSTLMQRLTGSTASREGYYEKRQIVNTTLYNGDNMLGDIETWTGKENLSAADGVIPPRRAPARLLRARSPPRFAKSRIPPSRERAALPPHFARRRAPLRKGESREGRGFCSAPRR